MDFGELVRLASAKCEVEKRTSKRILKAAFDILREELAKETKLSIEGLGTFAHQPRKDPDKPPRTIFHAWTGAERRPNHRSFVGGLWDSMGQLQFEFLRDNGLLPTCRLLDIGCGSLRAGVRLAEYLDSGNYYGTDINKSMLEAGYEIELKNLGLQEKVPRANLLCDGDFQFSRFNINFDFALAQSVFTHLSPERLRACLANLAPWMKPGGSLFATFLLVPDDHPMGQPFVHPQGVSTTDESNPLHYRRQQIIECAAGLPWTVTLIGDWKHPRDQQMVAFTRT